MDRMLIYQHVLNAYANAQKGGKKMELPPSVDKIVSILQDVPDSQIQPVISMVVNCEQDPRVLEAVQKLFRERGLWGKPGKAGHTESPKDLMASLGSAAS